MSESPATPELHAYYREEYIKSINLGTIVDDEIHNAAASLDIKHAGSAHLIYDLQKLKFNHLLDKNNTIVSCFKVGFDGASSIYGYAYSTALPNGEFVHQYITTGPTYMSQDGEYRSGMIMYGQMQKIFEVYSDICGQVEALVIDKIESGEYEFYVDFYHAGRDDFGEEPNTMPWAKKKGGANGDELEYDHRAFEDSINASRLVIRMYILCWLCDFWTIHHGLMANHMHPAYQYIMYRPEEVILLNDIIDELGEDDFGRLQECILALTNPEAHQDDAHLIYCGQKIMPLTVTETLNVGNIRYETWRELYITAAVSDFAPNVISPCFATLNNWFYIHNAHAGLFDNMPMHIKYDHSAIAEDIYEKLVAVEAETHEEKDSARIHLSEKFEFLSESLQRSILHNNSEIRLSNLAICATIEHLGCTLRDLPTEIAHRPINECYHLVFSDPDVFARHMFEFTYSAYCLNIKLGAMHGDLHLNNAIIRGVHNFITSGPRVQSPNARMVAGQKYGLFPDFGADPIPNVAYIVENDAYIFPHTGTHSKFIDFSRAILGDKAKIALEFGERFAEIFFAEQQSKVMGLIDRYFPQTMNKYGLEIEALARLNFPLLFKIISCIDIYALASNILILFEKDGNFTRPAKSSTSGSKTGAAEKKIAPKAKSKNGKDKIAPVPSDGATPIAKHSIKKREIPIAEGARQLLLDIVAKAEELITQNMKAAIEGKITNTNEIQWPNRAILEFVFVRYRKGNHADVVGPGSDSKKDIEMGNAEVGVLGDIYNSNNNLKYKFEDYDLWSPLMKFDKELELCKKYGQPVDPTIPQWIETEDKNKMADASPPNAKYLHQNDMIEVDSWMIT